MTTRTLARAASWSARTRPSYRESSEPYQTHIDRCNREIDAIHRNSHAGKRVVRRVA